MELIKAHINNFGKLSNLDIDFKKGLNTFIYENGWGKTTLSVFIKSMFYGMENTQKKDLDQNEKKKYQPWNKGIYGGNLIFSYKGREYQVSRTFGTGKNDNTFELRDLKTNKISTDFSENLGTEIFGINRETYARSVHVNLSQTPAGSSDISARLNNLVEAADISSFDKAMKKLDDKSVALKAKRGNGGLLFEIQDKIDYDRENLEDIKAKNQQNIELEKRIAALKAEADKLTGLQKQLGEEMSVSAKYESKLRYEALKNDEKNALQEKNNLIDFFNGQIPDENTLKIIDTVLSDFTTVESNLKNNSLTQSQKDQYEVLKNYFAGDVPSRNQIEQCLEADSEYKRFRQEESQKKLTDDESRDFSELKKKFAAAGDAGIQDLSEEKINKCILDFSEVQNIRSELPALESEYNEKKSELLEKQKKNALPLTLIIFLIVTLLCAAAGIFLFLFINPKAGIFSFGATALFLVLTVISKSAPKSNQFAELEDEIEKLNLLLTEKQNAAQSLEGGYKKLIKVILPEATNDFIALNEIAKEFNRYAILLQKSNQYYQWLQTQKKLACDYEDELSAFVHRYCRSDDIRSVPTMIQTLNEKLSLLNDLERRVNSDASNSQLQADKKEKLNQILSQYKSEKTLAFSQQVQQLHDKINDLKNADQQIANIRAKISEFENNPENDVAAFENLQKPQKSLEQIKTELAEVSDQITEKNAQIAGFQKTIDDNLFITDKKDDIESEIENLMERRVEKTKEYNILKKTAELLSKAKENLDANYSDPMKENFAKYVTMMAGEKTAKSLMIDTDLKVFANDSAGQAHDSEFLSEGYKDMVNFCSRMALVDALFKDEKPPVILDDPFVNLDDDKVESALSLVKKMAEEKQILYFACHKSREL